jgi:hypothetical protein
MKNFLGLAMLLGLTQACTTTTSNMEVRVPEININVDQSTPTTQSKSGVSMTLVKPVVEIKRFQDTRLKNPSLLQSAFNINTGSKLYPVEKLPVYYPLKQTLEFQVRVKNNLDRPLRLNGSIISIEMSDKIIGQHEANLVVPQELKISNSGMAPVFMAEVNQNKATTPQTDVTWNGLSEAEFTELQRVVVLPGKEKEIKITAPKHVNIPEDTSFTISFMDVVTKVDAASNPLAKESFSWIVNYSRKSTTKSEAVTVEDKLLNPMEVATLQQLNTSM